MPDINDIFPFLQPPGVSDGAPPPAPDPTGIPSNAAAQAPSQQPQLDPMQMALQSAQKDINNPVYSQDPAAAYKQFINKIYYGNQDGSEPTKKQKILRPLEDYLESIVGYQRPELKMLPQAEQAYTAQTGRIAQQTGIERLLGLIGYQQQGLGIKQEIANTGQQRVQATINENNAKDIARNLRVDIEKNRQLAQASHWTDEQKRMAMQNTFSKWQMDNPSNRYALMQNLMNSKDPEALQHMLALDAEFKLAETPLITTGSNNSSLVTTDQKGNTTTQNNKANTYSSPAMGILQRILGGNAQGPVNNMGIPIANGAPTGAGATTPPFMPPLKPQTPSPTPPTPPVTPPTAPTAGIPGMHPLQDNGGDPTDSRFPYSGGFSPKTNADYREDQVKRKGRTDQFRNMEFMSASLAQDLINTIKNGTNNWTGAFNGNPLMQKFRSDFGDITPDEAMGKGDFFNTMMTRARSAVQGAGRMNIPEIKMAGTTTGNQQENARNAALQAADASFKTGVQRLFDQGKVTLQDQPVITKAINAELNRIKSGQISTVRPIEDVIADESTKKTVYDKSGKPFTIPERQLQKVLATGNYSTEKPKGK